MTDIEYYQSYIGPPIRFAYLQSKNSQKEDIKDIANKLYGEKKNWNGKLYSASSLKIPNIDEKIFYIEFDNYNPNFPNHVDFTQVVIKNKDTFINPPMFMPFSKSHINLN